MNKMKIINKRQSYKKESKEILELKKYSNWKISLDGFNSKFESSEERINQ